MPAGPHVRPYRPPDRAAVRHVCFATGHLGDPVSWQYADAESFADLSVGWYLDHEPEHAWVVDDGTGTAAGYLVGALDSSQVPYRARVALRHGLRRALLVRPGTAGFLWRAGLDMVRARGRVEPGVDLRRWPSQLHINLLPVMRGHGLGDELLTTWLEVLGRAGSPGVHLSTFAENRSARTFFERHGFRAHGPPVVSPGFRSPTGQRLSTQAMVRELV